MNTMKQETTSYTSFELVHGRHPINPLDLALCFDGWNEISRHSTYAAMVCQWLAKAPEVVLEMVNKTPDSQAPSFKAHRSKPYF